MQLDKEWHSLLQEEIQKPYIVHLKQFLEEERKHQVVYPPEHLVFSAFSYAKYQELKVVIVGQDPYHGKGQAHGLSFSVPDGIAPPPSLKNIFRELQRDLNLPLPSHGNLSSWAKQGVLLLNTTLTVREGMPRSHFNQGWEQFTDAVIHLLALRHDPMVFLLWGKAAIDKASAIVNKTHHAILTAAHPSPYSAHNFFGCKHFSKANSFLKSWGKKEIDWSL